MEGQKGQSWEVELPRANLNGWLIACRGNVSLGHLQVLNAILYVAGPGCKWRGLPGHLGNWHTIYTRMNRWSKAGVLDRVFARLQQEQILAIRSNTCAWTAPPSKCIPTAPGR